MGLWQPILAALLGCMVPMPAAAEDVVQAPDSVRAGPAYPDVVPGADLVFPRDHGAHPGFRTEWWYITGWLEDGSGAERGFQVTFFRVRPRIAESGSSRFNPTQLVLAHAALADPRVGRLMHAERAERVLPPLVRAGTAHTAVALGNWSLDWIEPAPGGRIGSGTEHAGPGGAAERPALAGPRTVHRGSGGDGHYRARIETGAFAFDLRITPSGDPVLNGNAGYSRKGPDPLQASYYYSRPQLEVTGSLRVADAHGPVSGRAWLDHEWSSEILPPGARGWDWIGINLHDGGSLMAFRMRGEDGTPVWAGGTMRSADGSQRVLAPEELSFAARRVWQSPRSGARYPVEWDLNLAPAGKQARTLRIAPLMDDQELDSRRSTGAIYWEGAVRLLEVEDGGEGLAGREIGKGYLEMTGYAERLRM